MQTFIPIHYAIYATIKWLASGTDDDDDDDDNDDEDVYVCVGWR